ncbi:MAG: hypothetical protein AAB257_02560 [Nitrospinota bacterium]
MISNCMVILKPPEEPCPEPVMSLQNLMACRLLSQSVSQTDLTALINLFFSKGYY